MQFRLFGPLEWEISVLSIGFHRVDITDENQTIDMIRHAVSKGVNHLDLGYPFHIDRQERLCRIVAQALDDDYRKKIRMTATMPCSFIEKKTDFDFYLNSQMGWLHRDNIELLLLGGLNRETWPIVQDLGVIEWAQSAIDDGRIHYLGFSFHDHYQILKKVIRDFDQWVACEFQYSYQNPDHNPGLGGIQYAAEQGLAVIITESLSKGQLIQTPPPLVAALWETASEKRTLLEWGLRFAWNQPAVSTVVVNPCDRAEIERMAAIAETAQPEALTIREEVLFNRVKEAYRKLRAIPCPGCRPCMPCPVGIDIPRIFELYNQAIIFKNAKSARSTYCDERHDAGKCTGCGLCARRCAKQLPIISLLSNAHQLLGGRS